MPKKENEEVYCINNADHKMKKGDHPYMIPSIKNPEKDEILPVVELTKGFFLDIYCCEQCGYIEIYDNKE